MARLGHGRHGWKPWLRGAASLAARLVAQNSDGHPTPGWAYLLSAGKYDCETICGAAPGFGVGVGVGAGPGVAVAVGAGSEVGLAWPGDGLEEEAQAAIEKASSRPSVLAREKPDAGGERPGSQTALW